jgi:hypothetical protein
MQPGLNQLEIIPGKHNLSRNLLERTIRGYCMQLVQVEVGSTITIFWRRLKIKLYLKFLIADDEKRGFKRGTLSQFQDLRMIPSIAPLFMMGEDR